MFKITCAADAECVTQQLSHNFDLRWQQAGFNMSEGLQPVCIVVQYSSGPETAH